MPNQWRLVSVGPTYSNGGAAGPRQKHPGRCSVVSPCLRRCSDPLPIEPCERRKRTVPLWLWSDSRMGCQLLAKVAPSWGRPPGDRLCRQPRVPRGDRRFPAGRGAVKWLARTGYPKAWEWGPGKKEATTVTAFAPRASCCTRPRGDPSRIRVSPHHLWRHPG